jgi:hypothetical protein
VAEAKTTRTKQQVGDFINALADEGKARGLAG